MFLPDFVFGGVKISLILFKKGIPQRSLDTPVSYGLINSLR